jgi:ABC-type glycerol-3-phosphate transport system substrate-binding protein
VFEAWAYALVTPDPARQNTAWLLVEWLTSPDRMGEWALAAHYMPTRLSAWPENLVDGYFRFLSEMLQNSQIRPAGAGYDDVGRALQRAWQAVFAGAVTPVEGATQAAASIP